MKKVVRSPAAMVPADYIGSSVKCCIDPQGKIVDIALAYLVFRQPYRKQLLVVAPDFESLAESVKA